MKYIVSLLVMVSASLVFADDLSDLYQEFVRRDSIVITKEQHRVVRFLFQNSIKREDIKAIELYDSNDLTKFVVELSSGDICIGDVSLDSMRCKNSAGLTTKSFEGDSD